jgi:hypothetical protein
VENTTLRKPGTSGIWVGNSEAVLSDLFWLERKGISNVK